MTPKQGFTDEELTAFLDGEASNDLCKMIEASITPDLEARLAQLDRGKELGVDAFESLLAHAPDCDAAAAAPAHYGLLRPAAVFGGTGLAAGVVLTLGLGGWFGVASKTSAEPWHVEVAAYHALYVEQTLRSVTVDPDANAASLQALSTILGRDIAAVAEITDLQFVRAQQLGFDGAPLIQMAFLAEDGTPVALCILRQRGDAQNLAGLTVQGMAGASWAEDDLRFFLIGGDDSAATARQAEAFRDLLKGA